MIRAVYDRETLQLTVEGHAESGPYGKDLVCAAVSALTLTLWENLRLLEQADKLEGKLLDLDSGRACLSCNPKAPFRQEAEGVFQTVTRGIQCLSRIYPGYIHFTTKESKWKARM